MRKYLIEQTYTVKINQLVEAEDEGEALDKARNLTEEADMENFTIDKELESRIINQYD